MSDYEENLNFMYEPIPKRFWSFESDEPFKKCLVCSSDLLTESQNYFIEKAYNKGEVIFEYAMCFECRESLSDELSLKSRQLIENYFAEHIDFEERRRDLMSNPKFDIEHWLDKCLVKRKKIDPNSEYQIFAQCVENDLAYAYAPYAVSGEAIDDIIKLLSDETLGTLGDFTDKYLGIDMPQNLILI